MSEPQCRSWHEIALMRLATHDGVENIDLRTHVARCPECRRKSRELRRLEVLLLPDFFHCLPLWYLDRRAACSTFKLPAGRGISRR